jgi:hypothetical protein
LQDLEQPVHKEIHLKTIDISDRFFKIFQVTHRTAVKIEKRMKNWELTESKHNSSRNTSIITLTLNDPTNQLKVGLVG